MKKLILVSAGILLLLGLVLAGCQLERKTIIPTGGGTLTLYGIDPITLDPAVAAEMTSNQYVVQIFSGLVRLDEDMAPAPDIAESWELGRDRRTYTFHLRRNVYFHDGRRVTAADFKYSWERACSPATGSRVADTYLGDISGAKEVIQGKTAEISGVKVIDDHNLQVTIDAPRSYFLYKLTYPTSYVVDKNNVARGKDWWRSPNGTGPFRLASWKQGQELVLARHEKYHGQVAGVSRVVFKLWAGLPMNLYETGEIDVAGVSSPYIDRATDKNGPFYRQLHVSPELSFSYIGFNLTRPPFDDANVRRAFTMAIDKDKIISLSFRGMVQKAIGILPPGMPGYNESLTGLNYDPSRAREFISLSRYGDASNLPPITLTTSGYGGLISTTLGAIITQWRENLGVEVTVRQLEPDRFLYHLKEEKDELFDMGWVADYPHPQNFLDVLFRSGAENNFGEYANQQVDAILDQAALTDDLAQSLALYRQAEQILVDDAACLPLWFGRNYYLVKPYIQGYEINLLGLVMLNRISLVGQ